MSMVWRTDTVKPRSTSLKRSLNYWSVPIGWFVLAALLFGSWELSARTGLLNAVYVGQPSAIAAALVEILPSSLMTVDAVATFGGVLIGWALASVAGVAAALALSTSPYLMRVIDPFFTAFNSLPRVALAPLILLWFGMGLGSKVALSFSLAFFVVASNTRAGVESADGDRLLLARVLGASRLQTFAKFVLPGAVPNIITGLQLGFIFGMLATVAGEMLAAQSGLGLRLQQFASGFRINHYFATLVILVAGTMLISALMGKIRNRLLRWQATELGRGTHG